MEPITTALAINAVVLYLAVLADNKGISGFFNDFTDASVAWIKPVFDRRGKRERGNCRFDCRP